MLPWSHPTYMLLHCLQVPLLIVTQLATVHLAGREKGQAVTSPSLSFLACPPPWPIHTSLYQHSL